MADLAGDAPRRITPARRGLFLVPSSFSPDGETLLATRFVGPHREDAVSIQLRTGKVTPLVHDASDPIFSPDGTKVALVRWRSQKLGDGNNAETSDLFIVNASGKHLRRLTRTRYREELYQSWNPSGERLAFVRYPPVIDRVTELDEIGIGGRLVQMNSDGSCSRTVLDRQRSTALYGAAWQPGSGHEAGRIVC